MAKRGPGRPRSNATGVVVMGILNGEVPPQTNSALSPNKRKRGSAEEDSSTPKRRTTEKAAADSSARRNPSRLSRPSSSTEQPQSTNTGHKHSQDPWEGPQTPPPSSKAMKAMKKPANAKPALDDDNSLLNTKEGEEGAANALMKSPAFNTRNAHKRFGDVGQAGGIENLIVDVRPVEKAQRPQRRLNGTKRTNNILLKRRRASSHDTEMSSIRQHAPREPEPVTAGASGEEIGIQQNQRATNHAHQEHQDRSSPGEEPLELVEEQSNDGPPNEAPQLSGTKQAFETASRLYDCKESWDTMLEASHENRDDADEGNQASEIRELGGLIQKAKLAYRAVTQAEGADLQDREYEIDELLIDIHERVRTIRSRTNRQKDSRLAKDIYVHGIPRLVQLLKAALVTRSLMEEELSVTFLKELVKIIDTTLDLYEKASRWRPRPTLETGVRRRTRDEVKTSLEALRKAYNEAQYDCPDLEEEEEEKEEEAQKVEKRRELARQVANFLAREEERKKRVADSKRDRRRERIRRSPNADRLLAGVFDIDDLELNDVSAAPEVTRKNRSLPWRNTGVVAARKSIPIDNPAQSITGSVPRISRERTEEIPAPMEREWSKAEESTLLHGLEQFTGGDRFAEIYEVYGPPGGPLSGRDVDELMQRARFYKQSMASRIEKDREEVGNVDHWAFLLSVEG